MSQNGVLARRAFVSLSLRIVCSAALMIVAFAACRRPAAPRPAPCTDEGPRIAEVKVEVKPPPPSVPSPLASHGIVWSRAGDLVAAREASACGPPSGDGECRVRSWVRVVDVAVAGREQEHEHADAEVFGFRADGAWLVIRAADKTALEEWSPRTNETRPSDFAAVARDASRICLSPDDVHVVAILAESGSTVVRSRTSTDETVLAELTSAPLPPSDCAFSPDGGSFALAGESHVGVYRLGEERPDAWLPLAGASQLAWSPDGKFLMFSVRDAEPVAERIVYRWSPRQGRLDAHATRGPAVFHPRRPELLVRSECEWHRRVAADGKRLGRAGPAAETCFHVHEHGTVLSPTGAFVAALEGEWAARGLVVLPVP